MVESKPVAAGAGRAHETRVVVDAPIEEVWKALTEAEAIARWFAPKMTVEPGVGGFVLADFGPGMEWKTAIEVWEPNRHLRLAETRGHVISPVEEKMEECRLLQDYYLESAEGKTVLRLVHSGFGSSEAWTREYEGTRGGWAACFVRLKLGLERHRSETVHNFILTAPCPGVEHKAALDRILAAVAEPLEVVQRDKYEVAGLLPERNGSVLTLSVQPSPIGSTAFLELALFGMAGAAAEAVRDRWKMKLADLFPVAESRPA